MNTARSRPLAPLLLGLATSLAAHGAEPAQGGSVKDKVAEKWSGLPACAKGAIAGAAAGQVLGRRPIVGALAGCGTAHYMAGKKEAEVRAQREAEAAREAKDAQAVKEAREAQAAKEAQAAREAEAPKPAAADPAQGADAPKGDRPD